MITPHFPKQQRGAVLAVSLLLLLVMTVLALGASQATRLQERITGNARDRDIALQTAEAALRQGEWSVGDKNIDRAPIPCENVGCVVMFPGVMTANLNVTYEDQAFAGRAWWAANAQSYNRATLTGTGMANVNPQFYVEEWADVPDAYGNDQVTERPSRTFYRINARGEGGSATTEVMLQSTYARRWN